LKTVNEKCPQKMLAYYENHLCVGFLAMFCDILLLTYVPGFFEVQMLARMTTTTPPPPLLYDPAMSISGGETVPPMPYEQSVARFTPTTRMRRINPTWIYSARRTQPSHRFKYTRYPLFSPPDIVCHFTPISDCVSWLHSSRDGSEDSWCRRRAQVQYGHSRQLCCY
jgi:hypothetical protein